MSDARARETVNTGRPCQRNNTYARTRGQSRPILAKP
jgi:hypothetical protein